MPKTAERAPINALIIYPAKFEKDAYAFVRQNLQFRELHQHFYMLPIDPKKDKRSIAAELATLSRSYQAGMNAKNTNAYLIVKQRPVKQDTKQTNTEEDTKQKETKQNNKSHPPLNSCDYNEEILAFAKKFKSLSVIVTYNSSEGERQFNTLRARALLGHQRFTTSQGFSREKVTQIDLAGERKINWHHADSLFHTKPLLSIEPPFKLLLSQQNASFSIEKEPNQEEYQRLINEVIQLRQKKVQPILESAIQDYKEPDSIAEKISNLFLAYAFTHIFSSFRHHRWLAIKIALKLRLNPQWEIQECLAEIKKEINHSQSNINVKGTFQGILRAILDIFRDPSNVLTGDELKSELEDSLDSLEHIKNNLKDSELISHTEKFIRDLKKLAAKHPKPFATLIKATDAVAKIFNHPSESDYQLLSELAEEVGHHSNRRMITGLICWISGLALIASITTAIYFSGGAAALFGAPLIIEGFVLSATLINAGAAIFAGLTMTPLAFGGNMLFFREHSLRQSKTSLQKDIQNLLKLKRQKDEAKKPEQEPDKLIEEKKSTTEEREDMPTAFESPLNNEVRALPLTAKM